jgi:virginiamycin B lyase
VSIDLRTSSSARSWAAAWASLALLVGAPALAEETVFPANAPTGITLGPDGAMWFSDQGAGTIGRIDMSGAVATFPAGGSPQSIAAGPDRNLWYTLKGPGRIGRMTLAGETTVFPLPNANAESYSIASGPDGNLWFTEANPSRLGRITPAGEVTEFAVPSAPSWIGSITPGPDGNLWFTEPSADRIGRITPSGSVTEFALPSAGSGPAHITAGLDGNLWFTESSAERVGRISATGQVHEFPLRGGAERIVQGADGSLWMSSYYFVRRLTTLGAVMEYETPSIYGNAAGMATSPDGAIWIAVTPDGWGSLGQIVRLSFDTSACVAGASTLCLDAGRFRVTTEWKTPNGASQAGHASTLAGNSGYFWFFDPASVEVVVKVLDGCPANRHHWVFAAGLTNVEVTTRVTDTTTGLSREYTNPQGMAFAPIQDTSAFAACE